MTRTLLLAALLLGLGAALVLAQGAKSVSAKSPDGKLLATADKKIIKVGDAATGKLLLSVRAHQDDVTALAWSPDGKLLVSGDGGGKVCVIDVATGRVSLTIKAGQGLNKLTISADGRTVTAASPGATRKYDLATGKEIP
jgi:WD40 repeat protein